MHFYWCFGPNFNIQLKKVDVSQNFMVLYTILISSPLIYIHINSHIIITSSVVSGYQYLTLTWEIQVQFPLQAKTLFYFFLLFPGLSQIFTKKQSWNSRYADFFRMNIKILTTRVLKKWSELKKVTWKIVQLNLKSNSILLISQLLNYRFSKVRPFLESME